MSPEPDAWMAEMSLGNPTVQYSKSDYPLPEFDDEEIMPLFTLETIQEEIDEQIEHHKGLAVDAWNDFEREGGQASDRERAQKHSERAASLIELKQTFSESDLDKNGDKAE